MSWPLTRCSSFQLQRGHEADVSSKSSLSGDLIHKLTKNQRRDCGSKGVARLQFLHLFTRGEQGQRDGVHTLYEWIAV